MFREKLKRKQAKTKINSEYCNYMFDIGKKDGNIDDKDEGNKKMK